ncbi:MAG: hypothetical protein Q4F88_04035 [Eubacteriales bacterium]|nr:hypothetical protein [Eubacteriales bacterium]
MNEYMVFSRATIEINDESKKREIIDIVDSEFLSDSNENEIKKISEGIYEGCSGLIEVIGADVIHILSDNNLLQYLDKFLIEKKLMTMVKDRRHIFYLIV